MQPVFFAGMVVCFLFLSFIKNTPAGRCFASAAGNDICIQDNLQIS
jgi:hypothetical protein